MSKVKLIGYYGMKDADGQCVGHTVKVTNEYAKLINKFAEVDLYAAPCILNSGVCEQNFSKIHSLKFDIDIKGNSIVKRIIDKFKVIANIQNALRQSGKLFFYQIDFIFLLYILLFYHKRKNREVYCLIYHQIFSDRLMQKCIHKLDGVIYTQNGKEMKHHKIMWMPDYVYDEEIYGKYYTMSKENKVVCLGTMNRFKQLEELISAWQNISIPLVIAGRFDDQKRFEYLCSIKSDNVEIQNTVLEYDEYLTLMGSSRYSILPYDMSQYKNRTSGVLLETLYCGSIPIAPNELLEKLRLPGNGYTDINEFSLGKQSDIEEIVDSFLERCKERNIENNLKSFLCS